jgi:hypothetical protein
VLIVVNGSVGELIIAVPRFPTESVHVPAPTAAIVADPPGKIAHKTVLSGPALGLAVTVTVAVSLHTPFVLINVYTPGALKFEIVAVGFVAGAEIIAVPGLPVG